MPPPMTLMESIDITKNHVTQMIMFNKIKTGNPIFDAFITTIILGCFSWLMSWICDNRIIEKYLYNITIDNLKTLIYNKKSIIIEGKRSSTISAYNGGSMYVTSVYSNRFKALWNHIIENIETNTTIFKIKENYTNHQSTEKYDEKYKDYTTFMVYQNKHFQIDDDIYASADIDFENDSSSEKDKLHVKIDKITITIYSYKYSLAYLKNYIDNITSNYLLSVKESRSNKKYIYFLDKCDFDPNEESSLSCWREDLFESSRTFQNIFFDGKAQLIEKIDFFLNNKNWYYEKGIPYSLGIGLHGPPGTGKTSFIKALANYTNRHIIVISLKIIKTKQQLEKFFFENTYHDKNQENSISWDKKILVFEDIDCIGDIILDRNNKKQVNRKKHKNKRAKISDEIKVGDMKIQDILESVCDLNDTTVTVPSISKEIPITLDDILNLWDGIRETPGRILVISSNHYHKLDPALVRPGRIDITHELSNASHNVISELYTHLFGSTIDKEKLSEIKEYFYSPAELINFYVGNKNEEDFMNRLLQNTKGFNHAKGYNHAKVHKTNS